MRTISNCIRTISFLLCLGPLILASPATRAQKKDLKEISGTVTDSKGAALPGVTVNEKGTQRTTVTDGSGQFKLRVTGRTPIRTWKYRWGGNLP